MLIRNTRGVKNTSINFPVVGIQAVDENGEVEITDEGIAAALCEGEDWESAEAVEVDEDEEGQEGQEPEQEESEEESEPDETGAGEDSEGTDSDEEEAEESEEESEEEAEEETTVDNSALKAAIDTMKLQDLVNLAKDSGIQGWEKHKGAVGKLRAFLKENL